MDTREWIEVLGIGVGGVMAVGGIVTGILWLVKGHIAQIHELNDLKREVEPLRAEAKRAAWLAEAHEQAAERLKTAEAEKKQAENQRDQARRERDAERQMRARATEVASQNRDVAARNADKYRLAKARAEQFQAAVRQYQAQVDAVAKQDGRVWSAPLLVKPPEFVPLVKRPGRRPVIISVFNLKGGVGKTTLTANFGGYLAHELKKWVLLLDFDHQRSLTQTVFSTETRKATAAAKRTVQDFLRPGVCGDDLQKVAERVPGEGFDRLWLVGNSDADDGHNNSQNLDDVEMELLAKWLLDPAKCDVRYLLRAALHSPLIQERYDYVLIDCPPRLTTACVNALAASDFLLVPAQPDQVSSRSVPHLFKRLKALRDAGVVPDLGILGVVANMVSANVDKPHSREVKLLETMASAAAKGWGNPVRLLKSKIRHSDFYPGCQREADQRLRLPAVAVGDIRKQYEKLTKELEGIIHEGVSVAGVSS